MEAEYMKEAKYIVYETSSGDMSLPKTWEEANKVYEGWKAIQLEDCESEGSEKIFIFEIKKVASLVEDTDKKEDPKEYEYDFWLKWKEEVSK